MRNTLPKVNVARFAIRGSDLIAPTREALLKGDYDGHPFRGNQWMDSAGVSRGGAGSTPDQDRQAYEMRQAGQTWEAIAVTLGYANGGAVRRLAMRHEDRLATEGVRADPVTPPPEPRTEPTSPQTGYVNGLPPPATDQHVAAQEGRPLAGWVEFSPAIQARLDLRDRWTERNAQFRAEAEAMRDEAIKTMSEADSRSLLRMDGQYLVGWAAEQDAGFRQRLETHRAYLPSIDVNDLVSDMRDELIVAAGFRLRSESEKAELRGAFNELDSYSEAALRRTDERAAAKDRLAGEQLNLSYLKEGREGKGGRMRSDGVNEQVRARRSGSEEEAKAEFERQLLVKYDVKGLIAQGYTQQQIGDIYEIAYGIAADRTYTPTFLAVARGGSLTAAEILPQQLEAVAQLEGALRTSNITITLPPRVLAQVLKDGRYKTQFETRRSGGINDPQARSREEGERFGYPPHMKPEYRPVYGMVELGGVKAPSERENLQYGSAVVVLKSETRERTTFTVGDSLSLNRPSAPVMNPRAQPAVVGIDKGSFEFGAVARLRDVNGDGKMYLEAQIHGGVRASDIASVIFEVGAEIVGTGTRDNGRIIGTTQPPSRSVLAALDKAGIPYQIITKPEDIVQPVTKRWFMPWAMIKGDYVGHPFRGNQWSDASGAATSTTGASSAPTDPSRVMTDQQARTVANNLMDKMDIVAAAGAVIKIGEPPREVRDVYNAQLEQKHSAETDRPVQRLPILNGILTTEEALNDEGTVVVITDANDQILGALSMQKVPTTFTPVQEAKDYHPMMEVAEPNQKYILMDAMGSTGRQDGVGSTLFGQAVLNAARKGAGLYLTPLNQTAEEFWTGIGFKTVDEGQEFTKYQYLDAGSVQAIADNLDDPMATQ